MQKPKRQAFLFAITDGQNHKKTDIRRSNSHKCPSIDGRLGQIGEGGTGGGGGAKGAPCGQDITPYGSKPIF